MLGASAGVVGDAMNRLTVVKLISRLRREPFVVSSISVVDDPTRPGDGERWAHMTREQVPSR
jgi:hypothetical protein